MSARSRLLLGLSATVCLTACTSATIVSGPLTPNEKAHNWALTHEASITKMADDISTSVSDLVKYAKSYSPEDLLNLQAACTTMAADTVASVKWTLPAGSTARTDLADTWITNTQFAHDCIQLPKDNSTSAVLNTMQNVANDEKPYENGFAAFLKALA
jgi:hypothetical protein